MAWSRGFRFSVTAKFSGECRHLSSSILLRFFYCYFPLFVFFTLPSSSSSFILPRFFFVIITVFTSKEGAVGGTCSMHGQMKNEYTTLVGKLEWKRTLGRSNSRWVGDIKTSCKEMGCEDFDVSTRIFCPPFI